MFGLHSAKAGQQVVNRSWWVEVVIDNNGLSAQSRKRPYHPERSTSSYKADVHMLCLKIKEKSFRQPLGLRPSRNLCANHRSGSDCYISSLT